MMHVLKRNPLFFLLIGLSLALIFFICSGALVAGTSSPRLPVDVSPKGLTVELNTDRLEYYEGQNIKISGTVTDSEGHPVENGKAVLKLSCDEWNVRRWIEIENDGSYKYDYLISFGDPPRETTEATWKIEAEVTERSSNLTGKSTPKSIKVKIPADIVRYSVELLSPASGGLYQRKESVTISVRVAEEGYEVAGVDVSARSPTGDEITVPTRTKGYYQITYLIPWDDPLGDWCISIEAKLDNKVGGNYVKVGIEPAELLFEWGSPVSEEGELLTKFNEGEEVKVKVKLMYPDWTAFKGGTVTMTVTTEAGENEVVLTEIGDGGYWATVSREDPGNLHVKITAEDAYGNKAERNALFYFAPIPVVNPMVYVGASIGAGIALVAIAVVRRQQRLEKLEGIKWEKDHIQKLLVKEAEKYFREDSITRDVYDDLVRIHHARLAELEKEERMLVKEKK